jgi:hypothetical protein
LNPYLPNYMIAFAFFILLYLHGIVHSVTRGLPCAGNHTGLSRFELITGWVRCCLYAEGTISMYEVDQVHILPLYLLVKAYQQLSLLRMTTLTTVHICSPYHPSRHLPRCCYRRGNLVPTASDPGSLHAHVSVGSTDGTEGQLVSSRLVM